MRKYFILALAMAALVTMADAGKSTPKGFTDDFDSAIKSAEQSGKPLWVLFTGSDWCYWCKKLEKEHISKPDFATEGAKSFELVFLDFPQDQSLVRKELVKRNQKLAAKYGVSGYPTIVIIDAKGGKVLDADRPNGKESAKEYFARMSEEVRLQPQVEKLFGKFDQRFENMLNDEQKKATVAMGRIRLMSNAQAAQREQEKLMNESAQRILPKLRKLKSELGQVVAPDGLAGQKTKRIEMLDGIIKNIEASMAERKKTE